VRKKDIVCPLPNERRCFSVRSYRHNFLALFVHLSSVHSVQDLNAGPAYLADLALRRTTHIQYIYGSWLGASGPGCPVLYLVYSAVGLGGLLALLPLAALLCI
jgi:hypothetical protein